MLDQALHILEVLQVDGTNIREHRHLGSELLMAFSPLSRLMIVLLLCYAVVWSDAAGVEAKAAVAARSSSDHLFSAAFSSWLMLLQRELFSAHEKECENSLFLWVIL